MINNSNELQGKCALCGKTLAERQQGEKSYIIEEVIDQTSDKFDTTDCITMFKRFRGVYGIDFKVLVGKGSNNLFLTLPGIEQLRLNKK